MNFYFILWVRIGIIVIYFVAQLTLFHLWPLEPLQFASVFFQHAFLSRALSLPLTHSLSLSPPLPPPPPPLSLSLSSKAISYFVSLQDAPGSSCVFPAPGLELPPSPGSPDPSY